MPYMMVIMVLISSGMRAQEGSPGQRVAAYLETLAAYDSGIPMIADLADEIDALSENPVNINEASEMELSRLFFLTLFQVQNLAEYVRTRGKIISVTEIAYIPGFDRKLAELMQAFIIIDKNSSLNRRNFTGGRALLNITTRNSYIDSLSPGSPVKILTRVNMTSANTSIGLTMEKDQGEVLFHHGNGPDFISGYISYNNNGLVKNIILGDIKVRFGQGLVTWTGYSAGTTPLDPGLMKSMASVSPYNSSDENNFFRGAAVTAGTERHRVLAFISCNSIDATIGSTTGKDKTAIISFYDQGVHNSSSTEAKRDAVVEYSGGMSYNMNLKRIHSGLSVAGTRFSLPVDGGADTESYFDFSGRSNISLSFDHAFSFKNGYLFGEAAWNPGGGFAILEGIRLTPAAGTAINILYTNVMKGYNSFHGMANGGETVNDFGKSLLANFSFEPLRNLTVVTGVLYSHDHWYGRYGTPPSSTWRYEADARYLPSESLSLNIGLKHRLVNEVTGDLRGLKQNIPLKYTNMRINATFMPAERLVLQARVEFISGSSMSEPGFLIYNGLKYSLSGLPLSVFARIYVWSTPGYDSRIYAWEDDLLYSSAVLPYYYSGNRSYLVLSYKARSRLTCRFKVGFSSRSSNYFEESYNSEYKLQMIVTL